MVEGQGKAGRQAPRMLGHYEVAEQIGQGGMAVVYKGVQPSLNRVVAIKVLPERFARTEELLTRFDREANIAAQLNHPNIVQVIDRGKEGDTLFIVMEFVAGRSLDRMIQEGQLSVAQSLDYALQVCDALEYAHSKGVIHRDLKPSNILVDNESGRAKISDFGIAQIEATGSELSTLTKENISLGTINYMSPEQRLDSHSVTPQTDIFSFGVVLYEMLTRKLPLGHFKLPSYVNHQVPIGFDEIVKKCLAQSPTDRYQTAGEVRMALSQITGRHLRLPRKDAPPPMRWWTVKARIAIAGGAALLVIAVLAALLIHGHRGGAAPGPGGAPARNDSSPAGLLGTYRDEWDKMPLHGALSVYSAADQRALVQKLQKLLEDHPRGDHVAPALRLIADVSQPSELRDGKTAAEALMRLYKLKPTTADGAKALIDAADAYFDKTDDRAAAEAAYVLFVKNFPDDPRADGARKRLGASK